MPRSKAASSTKAHSKRGGPRAPQKSAPVLTPTSSASCPIVGVGASAGGLGALTALLKALPPHSRLAYVLIQHLDPRHESALTQILSGSTPMPVVEVRDGMAVEADHVYVIPPNKSMSVVGGVLKLTPRPRAAAPHHPIDEFYAALAEEQKSAAIGVILSGSGSDGTLGLKAIKAEGGITFAQEPETAEWPGMPMSAIAAGSVDFVLPLKKIGAELARIGRNPYLHRRRDMPVGEGLERICAVLRTVTGIDFSLYKQPTVGRRVARRMVLRKIETLSKYAQYLKQNAPEAHALAEDIFIHVTGFFRDLECFEALRKRLLPKLRSKRRGDDPVRIWVPGCSTGEEVYSIAMLLLEELGPHASRIRIQMFGTDISEPAINLARSGIYSEAAVRGVSAARLKRFFAKSDHGYQINKTLRDLCVFARHDLARDPPFSRLDLISCRNVLIYMGAVLQKRVLGIFQYALKPGARLLLGKSEAIGAYSDIFHSEDHNHKIFSRKPGRAMAPHFDWLAGGGKFPEHGPPKSEPPELSADFQTEAEQILLRRYVPPALVVDSSLRIVHIQGDTSRYLALSTGPPTFHLLKMIRPEFVVELRNAIAKARKQEIPASTGAISFQHDGHPATARLEVSLLRKPASQKQDFLVVFQEMPRVEAARPSLRSKDRQKDARLERELAATREYLRSLATEHEAAQEEMKAAGEEALSSNEELQSTNEELETAKEELQSSNEELITLNEELRHSNTELAVLSSDLLESSGQAIVAIGPDEKIVLINANVETMLGYRREELIGRPLHLLLPESARQRNFGLAQEFFAASDNRPVSVGRELDARRKDGTLFPVEVAFSFIDRGEQKLAVAFMADITERRRTEKQSKSYRAEISALAAQLITAQEEERRRVSRELHDSLCQQLAALSLDVEGLATEPATAEITRTHLRALQVRIVQASEEARHIAYELHPSALDDLGLVVSLKALCEDFSKTAKIPVKFKASKLPDTVSQELASAVYRIAKESLQNIAKHAQAKRVWMDLAVPNHSLRLSVKDDGVGFDPSTVQGRGGLGMVGMGERARMMGGTLSVESGPGRGTHIAVRVPLREAGP